MIASAKQFQTLPSLTQMVSGADWQTWNRNLGYVATYSQAFVAVDFLVEKRGLPSVIEYFRLFTKLDNRERNFRTAFGESVSKFTEEVNAYVRELVGK